MFFYHKSQIRWIAFSSLFFQNLNLHFASYPMDLNPSDFPFLVAFGTLFNISDGFYISDGFGGIHRFFVLPNGPLFKNCFWCVDYTTTVLLKVLYTVSFIEFFSPKQNLISTWGMELYYRSKNHADFNQTPEPFIFQSLLQMIKLEIDRYSSSLKFLKRGIAVQRLQL
mgnify:CR=1 FL=1